MRVQVISPGFLLLLAGAGLGGGAGSLAWPTAQADAGSPVRCFDFTKKVTEPLHQRIALGASKEGKLPWGAYWAAVRGAIPVPLSAVLKDVLDHGATKSGRISKMRVTPLEDPQYLAHQIVHFEVNPFLFVTVSWEEEWGIAVTKGDNAHPQSILISYEKTQGTSHIQHLCGNILLEEKSSDQTDVFIYEEAQATGRGQADTLQGIQATLRKFAKLPKPEPAVQPSSSPAPSPSHRDHAS